jgi:hypothetical protein
VAFLLGFEQCFTYRASISDMVEMMARAPRAGNDNILAATASYHAGLGNARAEGLYAPCGRIPEFAETINYINRVFINHQEFGRQL